MILRLNIEQEHGTQKDHMLTLWNLMWITLCALLILISFSPLFSLAFYLFSSTPFPFPLLFLFKRRSIRWSCKMLSSVCRTHLAKDMRYDRYVNMDSCSFQCKEEDEKKYVMSLILLANYQFNWHIFPFFFPSLLWILYALYSIIWGYCWMILWKDKSIDSISIHECNIYEKPPFNWIHHPINWFRIFESIFSTSFNESISVTRCLASWHRSIKQMCYIHKNMRGKI